jgi:hypothetical protein
MCGGLCGDVTLQVNLIEDVPNEVDQLKLAVREHCDKLHAIAERLKKADLVNDATLREIHRDLNQAISRLYRMEKIRHDLPSFRGISAPQSMNTSPKAEAREFKIKNLRQWLDKHIDDYVEINDHLTRWYIVDTAKLAKDLIERATMPNEAKIENLRQWLNENEHIYDYVAVDDEAFTAWYKVDTAKLAEDLFREVLDGFDPSGLTPDLGPPVGPDEDDD